MLAKPDTGFVICVPEQSTLEVSEKKRAQESAIFSIVTQGRICEVAVI
jgi:hypothetical protein